MQIILYSSSRKEAIMAKVILSNPTSGKAGSIVYSRNRWGAYIRALVAPVQPRTPYQLDQRAKLSGMADLWRTVSSVNKLGWDAFAAQILRYDTLGQRIVFNGYSAFILVNIERLVCGVAWTDTPPEMWDGAQPDSFLFSVAGAVMTIESMLVGGGGIASTGTAHLLAESAPWQSLGKQFCPTWRLFYVSATSTAFPIDVSAEYSARFGGITPSNNRRYFMRVRLVTRVDPPEEVGKFYVSTPVSLNVVSSVS